MSDEKQRRVWDQVEDEPAKAYALFLLYRSLGVGRSVRDVAKRIGRPAAKVQIVANRFNWVFRADQWDAWALRQRSKAQERRLLREAQVEAKTVADVLKMARTLARRTLRAVRKDATFTLTPPGAAQLADLAVKLARLERGEVTGRTETVSKRVRDELKEKLDQLTTDLRAHEDTKKKRR